MLLGLTVFIVMLLVSSQIASACNCEEKQTADEIELTVSTTSTVYGEKRCLCCYLSSSGTNSSFFFYKNGILICAVKDSGQFPWRLGKTECRKLSGSLAVLEIDPVEFNIDDKWRCGNDSFASKEVQVVNVQDSHGTKNYITDEYSTNAAHYTKDQRTDFTEVDIKSMGTYNSSSSDNSTSKDINWVIPLHISLVSFVFLIVVVIILIVLVIKRIMNRIKRKRYERTLIERRENEERYITLPRPISTESHLYESFENLAIEPIVMLPSRIKNRNCASVVAEIPKVTHLSIRYNSTLKTAQYQDGEIVESQPIQCDQRSNMNNPTTSSSDHSDHSQVNVCIRKFPKNAFQDPILNDGYLIPRAGNYHDMPLFLASNREATLELPKQSVVLQTQTVKLKKSKPVSIPISQETQISSDFTELYEPALDYQSEQTQKVQMPLLETPL